MGAALKIATPSPDVVAVPRTGPRALLRFITCGSVDDGKSTLIGRILYEAGAVFDDHLEMLDRDSRKFGTNGKALDFALLVDGLAAEREQGITIDVAYRYFSTPKRHFIVADTPGHEQYTRNMATGASTADLAILLVDARKGLLPQTRRHAFIVASMGVRQVILAINKMDLVGYDEAVFRAIEADFHASVAGLGFAGITAIPVSAREGDNLTEASPKMPWYRGTALLPLLETIEVAALEAPDAAFALPVQWVNRPDAGFRGFSGTIAAGRVSAGDAVQALPSGRESRIARIVTADGDLETASAGQAVTLVLEDEIDLSRGDLIAASGGARAAVRSRVRQTLEARLIVTGEKRIEPGAEFLLKLGTTLVQASVTGLRHAIDIETYAPVPAQRLDLNGIGVVSLRLDRPLAVMDYAANATLGGFILIDRLTNETSAFGFVLPDAASALPETAPIGPARRTLLRLIGPEGSVMRRERLTRGSWRLASALAVGGIVGLASGQGGAALAAGLADLVLRPLARAAHDALFARVIDRREAALTLDGGGI
jgi:bifunctional enzyme CysN/CysC